MINFKSNIEAQTVEEIYNEINSRQIAALMFHRQMSDYFDFLCLRGYKRLHEYQYLCECKANIHVSRYYINHHGKLLSDSFSGEVKMIPAAWLTANRMSVGRATKQKAVEDGFNVYHTWEAETKAVYEKYAVKLRESGHEADAIFVDCLVEDVDKELKKVESIILDLISTGYDMVYIVEIQKETHDKYKRMAKENEYGRDD